MTTIKKGRGLTLSTAAPDLPPGGTQTQIESMPLIDLLTILDAHAEACEGIPTPARYPRPSGLPERLSIPAEMVVPGRWQPRSTFEPAELEELAESIKVHGVINPIIVFVNELGKFELIAGERRLRAARLAQLHLIPAQILAGSRQSFHELSIVDNLQRQNLNAWEEGLAFERMISELQISEAELSRQLGKNRAYIQQRRTLATAHPDIRAALAEDRLSLSQARGLLAGAGQRKDIQRAALKLIEAAIKKGVPVKESHAKTMALEAATDWAKTQLERNGWKFERHYLAGWIIYSPADKPRLVEADDLLKMCDRDARPAPGPGPEPYQRDNDLDTVIYRRGYQNLWLTIQPWTAIYLPGPRTDPMKLEFYGAADIPGLARTCQEYMDSVADRAQALGWELIVPSIGYPYLIRGDDRTLNAVGSANNAEMWRETETMLAQIGAGETIQTQPRERCTVCNEFLEHRRTMYHNGGTIHVDCKEAAFQQYRASITESAKAHQTQPQRPVPAWIMQIPHEDLLVMHEWAGAYFGDQGDFHNKDLATLRAELVDMLEDTEIVTWPNNEAA